MTVEQKHTTLAQRSREFERELIGHLLVWPESTIRAIKHVSIEDFAFFGNVYEIIITSYRDQRNVTAALVEHKINLTEFLGIQSSRRVAVIADDVRECGNARRLFNILGTAFENIPTVDTAGFAAQTQQQILTSVSRREEHESGIEPVIEELEVLRKERREKPHELLGISTGNKKLDEITEGIRKGHLWIIGGYTNIGKTAASLNFVAEFARQGKRVVYYSIEMSKVDILTRLTAIVTKTSGTLIAKGINQNEGEVQKAFKLLSESHLGLHSGISELDDILFSMYEEQLRNPADLFVVDFIQLISSKGAKSEYETVTAAALGLQLIAKKLQVPIIVLSQISNESAREGNSSVVMGFKSSGAIASAADVAIQIVSAEESQEELAAKLREGQPTNMRWKILKNRHGRTGTIEMKFQGRLGIFELSEFETI